MPRKNSSAIGDLEKLVHWIQHIAKASKKHVIITQHKKARDILKSFGCKNVMYPTKPEYAFIDRVIRSGKPCILVFDGDRKSNAKCEKLKSTLQQNGVKVNTRFRKIIFTQKMKDFCGLLTHLRKMAGTDRKR